jgi:hypothetical protein
VHPKSPDRTKKTRTNPRRKLIVARIDANDYKQLAAIARSNNRSVGAEVKHKLEQLFAV